MGLVDPCPFGPLQQPTRALHSAAFNIGQLDTEIPPAILHAELAGLTFVQSASGPE